MSSTHTPPDAGVDGGFFASRGLVRTPYDRKIAGVCACLARVSGFSPLLWRVIFSVFVLSNGVGVALYVLCWLFIPSRQSTQTKRVILGVIGVLVMGMVLIMTDMWSWLVFCAIGGCLFALAHHQGTANFTPSAVPGPGEGPGSAGPGARPAPGASQGPSQSPFGDRTSSLSEDADLARFDTATMPTVAYPAASGPGSGTVTARIPHVTDMPSQPHSDSTGEQEAQVTDLPEGTANPGPQVTDLPEGPTDPTAEVTNMPGLPGHPHPGSTGDPDAEVTDMPAGTTRQEPASPSMWDGSTTTPYPEDSVEPYPEDQVETYTGVPVAPPDAEAPTANASTAEPSAADTPSYAPTAADTPAAVPFGDPWRTTEELQPVAAPEPPGSKKVKSKKSKASKRDKRDRDRPASTTPSQQENKRKGRNAGSPHQQRRRTSALAAVTFSLIVIAMSIMAIVSLAGPTVPFGAFVGVALVLCGCGLVIGTWAGRSASLYVAAVFLAAIMTANIAVAGAGVTGFPLGTRYVNPSSVEDVASVVEANLSSVEMDLREVPMDSENNVGFDAYIRGGAMLVQVPEDVTVVVHSREQVAADVQVEDGVWEDGNYIVSQGVEGSGEVAIDAFAGFGSLEVVRG